MEFLKNNPKWIRQPKQVQISEDKVVILTERGTDLWARTYYGFQNDNAPVFQVETTDKYFSFIVKTEFESTCRFDQCGVAMYLNSDNWFKASIEYENEKIQRLGSVVTNHGFSFWVFSGNTAVISVSTNPGATALTQIPLDASSLATDFVRPITPALLAA